PRPLRGRAGAGLSPGERPSRRAGGMFRRRLGRQYGVDGNGPWRAMRRGETPELGDRRRTVSTTSAMVLLVVAALVVGTLAAPLAAQEAPDEPPGAAAAADEPSGEPVAFPAPLVAATAAPDQPELAVRSLYV